MFPVLSSNKAVVVPGRVYSIINYYKRDNINGCFSLGGNIASSKQ